MVNAAAAAAAAAALLPGVELDIEKHDKDAHIAKKHPKAEEQVRSVPKCFEIKRLIQCGIRDPLAHTGRPRTCQA